MNWKEFIVSDNHVLLGKPCIKGTRISVEFLIQLLASGWTESQIFENYPNIKPIHLQAVFTYMVNQKKWNF
ncbi:MAG: DUF433 domain-containing protein [Saprospiraceae bacterium]|nr:DUF433 domain-containing protein [Saprospiraceae bacterium]